MGVFANIGTCRRACLLHRGSIPLGSTTDVTVGPGANTGSYLRFLAFRGQGDERARAGNVPFACPVCRNHVDTGCDGRALSGRGWHWAGREPESNATRAIGR
jgi:hypothetical protein